MRKLGLVLAMTLFAGCAAPVNANLSVSEKQDADKESEKTVMSAMDKDDKITVGSKTDRGFIVDNVYHDEKQGDIYFSSYFPDSYDGSEDYALFVTNPGWEGEYPQGLGNNLGEDFPFEARNYNDKMIILSTQLMGWDEKSGDDSLALIHHFLDTYAIDKARVYLHGYSGGGETGSYMLGKEPELFAAAFLNSTRWNSNYDAIVKARTPLRLAVGEDDSYYGSEPLKETYAGIY